MSPFETIKMRIKNGNYTTETNSIKMIRLMEDLFSFYGIEGHPKAQLVFDLAWDYALIHSEGRLMAVLINFDDFVHLIKS